MSGSGEVTEVEGKDIEQYAKTAATLVTAILTVYLTIAKLLK